MKGVDAAKVLAPLLIIADQSGMEGGSAGNAYRKVFQAALNVKNVKGVNSDLKANGSHIQFDFTNGKGSFGGIENLYKQLEKLNKLNDVTRQAVIKDLFGDDAETLQVVQKMISTGIQGYRDVEAKLQTQASLRERVDSQLKTLGNRWEAASGSFTNALAAIGGTVAPQIKEMADWLGELANKLGDFVKKHPQFTSAIFKTIAAFSLLAVGGGILAITLSGTVGTFGLLRFAISNISAVIPVLSNGLSLLSGTLRMAGTALLWIGRAALANPVLAILTGIALAGIYIWQNWETLGPKITALWNGISSTVSSALTAIRTWMSGKWNEIVADIEALPGRFKIAGNALMDSLMNGISEKWDSLKAKLSSLTDLIPDWLKPDSKTAGVNVRQVQQAKQSAIPFAGLYDSGGYIPRGQFGIVGENGPELVNGPANITSRRRTAALAAATAFAFSGLSQPVAAKPLHPYSLPKSEYGSVQQSPNITSLQTASIGKVEIHIHQQPGQSPGDVADEVMRRIEAKQRQLASRTRSSFRDQGDYDF